MMATTHVLVGLAVGAVSLLVAPEAAPVALIAGALGGAAPDLDLYAGHRKTLHFPTYGPLTALAAAGLAMAVPETAVVAAATFLTAAALHAAMDEYAGGLELRPWLGTSNRAVFDHRQGDWRPPRRWVRYDGAPEDLALAGVVGFPLVAVLDGIWLTVILGLLALSGAYVVLRKPLVGIAELLVKALPGGALRYVPHRFLADIEPSQRG